MPLVMRFDKIYVYVSFWDYEAGALLRPGIFYRLNRVSTYGFCRGRSCFPAFFEVCFFVYICSRAYARFFGFYQP